MTRYRTQIFISLLVLALLLQSLYWRSRVERLQTQVEKLSGFVVSRTVTKKPTFVKKILKEKAIQVPKGVDESQIKRLIEITPVNSGTITLVETQSGEFLASSSTVSEIFVERYDTVPRFVFEPKVGVALAGSRAFDATFFVAANVFKVSDFRVELGLTSESVNAGICRRVIANLDIGAGVAYKFDKTFALYVSASLGIK